MQGNPLVLLGPEIKVGDDAPDCTLVANDLSEVALSSYKGKVVVLSVVPSLDTPVCDVQTRKFNEEATALGDGVVIVTVSADLPFAQGRFCSTENIDKVVPLSMMRSRNFAKDYGVLIDDGPLAGITARAVVVLDEDDKVVYTELVPEIAQEPDYDAALAAL